MACNGITSPANPRTTRFRRGIDNLLSGYSRPLPSHPRDRSPTSLRDSWWSPPTPAHQYQSANTNPHALAVLRAAVRLSSARWPDAARSSLLRWRGCALRDWRALLIPQLLARVQMLSRASQQGWQARLLRGATKRAVIQWFSAAYKDRYGALFNQYSNEVSVLTSMAEGLRSHLEQYSSHHSELSENGQGYARVLECHSVRVGHLEKEKASIRNDCTVLVTAVVGLEEEAAEAIKEQEETIDDLAGQVRVLEAQLLAASAMNVSVERKLAQRETDLQLSLARAKAAHEHKLLTTKEVNKALLVAIELAGAIGTEWPLPEPMEAVKSLCACDEAEDCEMNQQVQLPLQQTLDVLVEAFHRLEKLPPQVQELVMTVQSTRQQLLKREADNEELRKMLQESFREKDHWRTRHAGLLIVSQYDAWRLREARKALCAMMCNMLAEWSCSNRARQAVWKLRWMMSRHKHQALEVNHRDTLFRILNRIRVSLLCRRWLLRVSQNILLDRVEQPLPDHKRECRAVVGHAVRVQRMTLCWLQVLNLQMMHGVYVLWRMHLLSTVLHWRTSQVMVVNVPQDVVPDTVAVEPVNTGNHEEELRHALALAKAQKSLLMVVKNHTADRQACLMRMMTYWMAVTHCTAEITAALDAMYKSGKRNAACRLICQQYGDLLLNWMTEAFHVWCGLLRKEE